VPSVAVERCGQHDLHALGPKRHLVIVDFLDRVTIDLAAHLGQHMGGAALVEQQRLVTLRHDTNDPQRDLVATRVARRWTRFRGLAVVGAHERSEQAEREQTRDEAHDQYLCNLRSRLPEHHTIYKHLKLLGVCS
jgi:hypothetical protein